MCKRNDKFDQIETSLTIEIELSASTVCSMRLLLTSLQMAETEEVGLNKQGHV